LGLYPRPMAPRIYHGLSMGCLKMQPEPRAALYNAMSLKARHAGVLMMESPFKVNLLGGARPSA
jgi:hypothetical protein